MSAQNVQALNNLPPEQANLLLRQQLAATGVHQDKNIGTFNLTPGGTTQILLQNIGITTRLRLFFNFNYTVGATAAVLSPHGLLNSVTRIQVSDFTQQNRISASALHLWMKNSLRSRQLHAVHNASLSGISAGNAYGTAWGATVNANSFSAVPSAGLATGAESGQFFIDVPLCVDPDMCDYRGAMALNSNFGQAYLKIDLAAVFSGAADDTKIFNNAAATNITIGTCQVEVLQEFVQPQPDPSLNGLLPIPQLDLNTVYELVSSPISANIAAGQETLIALPNTRSIMGIYYRWINNGVQGGTGNTHDISQHRVIVNGTTALKSRTQELQYLTQRVDLNAADLGKGMYFFDAIGMHGANKQPWITSQLGNLQLGLTPATNDGGTTYIDYCVESLYSQGTSLGAVVPAST